MITKLFKKTRTWWRSIMRVSAGASEFLCDTCQYDHGAACRRRERPNAVRCDDYRGK